MPQRNFEGECIQSEDGTYKREVNGVTQTIIAWRIAVLQPGDTQMSFLIRNDFQADLYEECRSRITVGSHIRIIASPVPGMGNQIKWRAQEVEVIDHILR